jgi:hypothetical protein
MAEGEAKDQGQSEPGTPVQPGTVISPGGQAPEQNTPVIKLEPDEPAEPGVVVAPEGETAAGPLPAAPPPETVQGDDNSISWTASEYVAHDKSPGWYLALMIGAAGLSVLIYLMTHDFISVGVVLISALLIGSYGSRRPRQLEYRVDQHGIAIGGKNYSYRQFRYFSVVPEGAFSSMVFIPLSRFALPLSIYYAPEDEEKILAVLSDHLPFEPEHRDPIDNLMRRIRF